MTKEELKKHCLKQVEACEMWAKHNGEEPHGKIYEEHKLILELLEQEPCEDCISREKLDKALRNFVRNFPSINPQEPKLDTLDEIRAEIDRQEKWLMDAGYNAYNVDIAFNSIRSVVKESEE